VTLLGAVAPASTALYDITIKKVDCVKSLISGYLQTRLFVSLHRSHCTETLQSHCCNNGSDRCCCSDATFSIKCANSESAFSDAIILKRRFEYKQDRTFETNVTGPRLDFNVPGPRLNCHRNPAVLLIKAFKIQVLLRVCLTYKCEVK